MKKLTLEQCNALPIESLVIAVIAEDTDTPSAQAFREARPEKWDQSCFGGLKKCRRQTTSMLADILQENGLLDVPKDAEQFWEGVNAVRDLSVMLADVKFVRPSVLYRCPDGKYLDLNGYGNNFYEESSLRDIRPFSDYFTRDQFRFVPAAEKPSTPNQDGIHIDMKWEADGFERYRKDINF